LPGLDQPRRSGGPSLPTAACHRVAAVIPSTDFSDVRDICGGLVTNLVKLIVFSTNAHSAISVSGPAIANGQFTARFAGVPAITYTVQSSDNLATPVWTSRTNVVAPGYDLGLGIGVFGFTDNVSIVTNRFYRAITKVPTIVAFRQGGEAVTAGDPVTISYTVSDPWGLGLQRVELWRYCEGTWSVSQTNSCSGAASISGTFSESPQGSQYENGWREYQYSVHVVDLNGDTSTESDFGLSPFRVYVYTGVPRLSVSPTNALTFGGWRGGPVYYDTVGSYTVENMGGGVLKWTAEADQNWLTLWPFNSWLYYPYSHSGSVQFSINTNANLLPPGTYISTVTFGGNGGNITRQVKLNVR
jgi:hypothetical protein